MPLLWAHAEFLKLLVAREHRHPVEQLKSVALRYAAWRHNGQGRHGEPGEQIDGSTGAWHWRDEVPVLQLEAGRSLLVEAREPFTLQLGFDGWQRAEARVAVQLPFGLWGVRLSAPELSSFAEFNFTRRFGEGWEGVDHRVTLGHVGLNHALAPAVVATD
jgi:glucoamylase